ncbi:MAG: cytidine deaminase [Candidatus Marinimicrobia bacterium]|nr:cytidine deaminase [Candidatus Neomarinimicrobiota bacterium]|tara:strand:- start:3814 stop:4194 length:381 start_codon:yes stop_codon:yes gene_type:complete
MKNNLIEKAISMRKRAHALFSGYKVGSAVKTKSGEIIGGCNIESSSYGLTCCAERVALYRSIAKGYSEFDGIAVSSKNACFPCGACRQVIWDLCGEIPIFICNEKKLIKQSTSLILLPEPFDKSFL